MSDEQVYKAALQLLVDYYENRTPDSIDLEQVIKNAKKALNGVEAQPVPWKVAAVEKPDALRINGGEYAPPVGAIYIKAADGNPVCLMEDYTICSRVKGQRADAELICRSVNAHATLVAALERVAGWKPCKSDYTEHDVIDTAGSALDVLK